MSEQDADKLPSIEIPAGGPYRVMVVDDSSVVRRYLTNVMGDKPYITVVAQAENGKIALEKLKGIDPDIILLDVEMPEMDGITVLPKLLETSPRSRIIMISALTTANARISIKALAMGASDCLEKPTASTDPKTFEKSLLRRIKGLGDASRVKHKPIAVPTKSAAVQPPMAAPAHKEPVAGAKVMPQGQKVVPTPVKAAQPETKAPLVTAKAGLYAMPKAVAIGSSTGGPQALITLFTVLGNDMGQVPVFITQHMPPTFTTFLAERLSAVGKVKCFEPKDGHKVVSGEVYLAPGGFHMLIKADKDGPVIRLTEDPPENFCRPAVDPMLRSLVDIYGKSLLTVILTGMGQDGLLGAKAAAAVGGEVVAQDEATSVVWGMPGAVAQAGICNKILPLDEVIEYMRARCKNRVM